MVWESSYPGTRTDNIIRPGKETGHERHIGIEEVVQSGILADQKGKLAGRSKLAVDVAFPRHFRGRGEVAPSRKPPYLYTLTSFCGNSITFLNYHENSGRPVYLECCSS